MSPSEALLVSNVDQNWARLVEDYKNHILENEDGPPRATEIFEILGSETPTPRLLRLMSKNPQLAETVRALAQTALGEVLLRATAQATEELSGGAS